ncbi:MAG: helix-turn-helix domain-containing protein, partial [Mycobacterium sp.]|nr:helix-turn-helix domain-containing protein [Mycobacterium sp.]
MNPAAVKIGVGSRLLHDGQVVQIVEVHPGRAGMDLVLKDPAKQTMFRASLNELLGSEGTRVIADTEPPINDDPAEPAGILLGQLNPAELGQVRDRAAHVREVLTGFRSGSAELALSGEPRPEYRSDVPLSRRYASKARELGAGQRTVERWVQQFQQHGEAGLAGTKPKRSAGLGGEVDPRRPQNRIEGMVEQPDQARPPHTLGLDRTN